MLSAASVASGLPHRKENVDRKTFDRKTFGFLAVASDGVKRLQDHKTIRCDNQRQLATHAASFLVRLK